MTLKGHKPQQSFGPIQSRRHWTDQQVSKMLELHVEGFSYTTIGERFGCSNTTILELLRGKTVKRPAAGRQFAKLSDVYRKVRAR